VHESVAESVISDTYTFGALILSCYVGYLLDSSALQWIAGLMLITGIVTRGIKQLKQNRYTIAEARAKLDELEAKFKT